MHVTNVQWWILSWLLLTRTTLCISISDLGLPNNSNCAFAVNNTLYIVGQQTNVSIAFHDYHQPPEILYRSNSSAAINNNNNNSNSNSSNNSSSSSSNNNSNDTNNNSIPACSITRSGKLLLLPRYQPLQTIENITSWQHSDITFDGSQDAIDAFVTRTMPILHPAITSFNDYILMQGGEDENGIQSRSTFILDTRYPSRWTWYKLDMTPLTPLPSSSNAVLHATSRWILYFRAESRNSSYIISVDSFDPYTFLWLGTIASFRSETNFVQPVSIPNSTAVESDSLLLIPSWSMGTRDFDLGETKPATNNNSLVKQSGTFWKLDVSKTVFDHVTLSSVNASFAPSNSSSGSSSSSSKRKRRDDSTDRASADTFQPVLGGTVTLVAADLAVFYGGTTASQQQQNIQFFNMSQLSFLAQPAWLITSNDTQQQQQQQQAGSSESNHLAIILGSVMGGLLFIAILILFAWCWMRRRRSRDPRLGQHDEQKRGMFGRQKSREMSTIAAANSGGYDAPSSSSQPYVLSPIQPHTPIDCVFGVAPEQQQQQPQASTSKPDVVDYKQQPTKAPLTSRFIEHFDYHDFSLASNKLGPNKTSVSLGNMANLSSPPLKIATTDQAGSSAKQLPRSASFHV